MSRRNRKRGLRRNTTGRGRSVLCHEPLEDRRLLAVVTSAADAGAGSLREALGSGDATITFDTVAMGSSTINVLSALTVPGTVTSIDGSDGSGGRVTLDGGGTSNGVLTINDGDDLSNSTVSVSNLVITGANRVGRGGAILTHENLTVDNVLLTANNATTDGAGISTATTVTGHSLTISNSEISNNTAADDAVAVDFLYGQALTITDSVITGNQGGGATVTGAVVGTVRVLTGASATSTQVRITGSEITNNSLLAVADGTATGTTLGGGLTFFGNEAYSGNLLEISDSVISGNAADAIDLDPDDANSAGARGGGVYVNDVETVTISDTTFDSNYAYTLGGALNVGGADVFVNLSLDNVTMTGNGFTDEGTTVSGGAIELISFLDANGLVTGGVTASISGSTFENNEALFGGAIRFQQGTGGTVTNSTFTGNQAYAGGAINFAADNREGIVLNIDSSTISGNSATASGGGISSNAIGARSFAQTLNITNSTISGNTQAGVVTADYYGDGGGGIALTDGTILNLSGSTVTGNTATNGVDDDTMTETPVAGGGILIGALNLAAGASVVNMNGSIVSGNTIVGTLGTESAFGFDIGDVDGGITGLYPARTTTSFSIVGIAEGSGLIAANPDGSGNKIGTVASPLDAMLNPLADNGGPTFTHLPMLGSPAIDMGDPASTLTVDQRGGARPFNGTVDIGSVEVGADVGPDCDLNGDGACDTADLRVLYDNIAGGSATNADIAVWLADAGAFNSKTYVPGDTNLDGEVGGGDFTALASSFGASGLPGAYWDQGNFDGNDGGAFSVGGGDFTALASNFGFMSPVAARANGHDGTGLERRSISSRDSAGSHMAIADFEREVETTSTPDRQEKFVPRAAANIEGRRVIVSTEVEEKSVVVDQFVPLQSVNKIAETSDDRLRVSRSANVDRVFAEFELA